ncbi:conserved domain protein [Haemophilus pittmaniae HK 85]|nr:conserved domain protein [Haemophilus pittmaniae HK 85]
MKSVKENKMNSSAIIMMIIALVVIWGGLLFALIRLPKED